MGFRSRVREYVRSLTSRRHLRRVVNFSTSVPPPSTSPGTALSPISEESAHLRAEDFSASEGHDDVPTTTLPSHARRDRAAQSPNDPIQRSAQRTTPLEENTNRTRFQLPPTQIYTDSTSHAYVPPTPSLYSDQYVRLGPSKCFVVPAGRDDYLVRIIRLVHLGDVESARPDEIKFSAPNSYYAPKIGHCVLLQCGYQQYIARVILKISADEGPNEVAFRARDPHDEKSISRILDEPSLSPQPLDPNSSTSDMSVFEVAASPYTPALSDMALLRTPANRISSIRQRSRGSLDSSTSSNSSNVQADTRREEDAAPPQDSKNDPGKQQPPQAVSESRTSKSEPTHLEAGGQASKLPPRQTPEGDDGRPHSQQEHEETEADDPSSDSEQMASSLDDLKNLQPFESPYVPSSGENSGWNTPRRLPHSPPRSQPRMPNSVLLPPRMYVQGWSGGRASGDESSDSVSRYESEDQRGYPTPILPITPPGFVPFNRVPPQFATPTRMRHPSESPEGVLYYDYTPGYPNANLNVRFSDYASVRVHEEASPSLRSPRGSSSIGQRRRSTTMTIPLPPSPTSPEPITGPSTGSGK
ncbi:hypothetical protein E1B28_000016 [Marasmius oreades]|uniref:Uncharacterized protein n=1 Tax=Marasmius oreades TaxID=181124 RepID=A0A9P8AE66_9AGAR|nr:uncharacterized protein E1B28_000016 [Marasmius oreades]KAG7098040.1 hypothetical protein E1B28_000016 [Marasmius oreades]